MRALHLARYLLQGMDERRDARYAKGDFGEPCGWQTEVNELRRILDYVLEAIEDSDEISSAG